MRFLANAVFVALCGVFLSGCSLTFPARLSQKTLNVLPKATIERCDTHALPMPNTLTYNDAKSRDGEGPWQAVSFTYQPRNTGVPKNDIIRGEFFFQNPQVRRTSLVVLLPGKGENVSTKKSAEVLADAGFSVLRFRSGIALFDKKKFAAYEALTENDVRSFARDGARVIERRACDYHAVINYFNRHFCFDAIGVSGVSLGGIFTPILVASYPKAHSALVMISGANIAEILRTSEEKNIVEIRKAITVRFNGDPRRVWQILKEEFARIDPSFFVSSLDPLRTRIIVNYWDAVIPFRLSKELWKAAGKPDFEVIIFPPGHYGSALLLWVPMVRWRLWHGIVPYPWRISRVSDINLDFFTKTLPR